MNIYQSIIISRQRITFPRRVKYSILMNVLEACQQLWLQLRVGIVKSPYLSLYGLVTVQFSPISLKTSVYQILSVPKLLSAEQKHTRDLFGEDFLHCAKKEENISKILRVFPNCCEYLIRVLCSTFSVTLIATNARYTR